MKKTKTKFPTNAQLRKAVTDFEESDLAYKYMPGFQCITVKNIEVDKDYDTQDEYVIGYSATVECYDSSHTHHDCWVTFKDIKRFLK